MKKLFFLISALLVLGFASCSTDFWDGFNEGYNATRSYEGELPPNSQPYEHRLKAH